MYGGEYVSAYPTTQHGFNYQQAGQQSSQRQQQQQGTSSRSTVQQEQQYPSIQPEQPQPQQHKQRSAYTPTYTPTQQQPGPYFQPTPQQQAALLQSSSSASYSSRQAVAPQGGAYIHPPQLQLGNNGIVAGSSSNRPKAVQTAAPIFADAVPFASLPAHRALPAPSTVPMSRIGPAPSQYTPAPYQQPSSAYQPPSTSTSSSPAPLQQQSSQQQYVFASALQNASYGASRTAAPPPVSATATANAVPPTHFATPYGMQAYKR